MYVCLARVDGEMNSEEEKSLCRVITRQSCRAEKEIDEEGRKKEGGSREEYMANVPSITER